MSVRTGVLRIPSDYRIQEAALAAFERLGGDRQLLLTALRECASISCECWDEWQRSVRHSEDRRRYAYLEGLRKRLEDVVHARNGEGRPMGSKADSRTVPDVLAVIRSIRLQMRNSQRIV